MDSASAPVLRASDSDCIHGPQPCWVCIMEAVQWESIFSQLDSRTLLLVVPMVCRHFREVCQTSMVLPSFDLAEISGLGAQRGRPHVAADCGDRHAGGADAMVGCLLARFTGCHSVRLRGCQKLGDSALTCVIERGGAPLVAVDIGAARDITTSSICDLVSRCPQLTTLAVPCQTSDACLSAIARSLGRLRTLRIGHAAGVCRVSDKALLAACSRCPVLDTVALIHCLRLSGDSFRRLMGTLRELRRFEWVADARHAPLSFAGAFGRAPPALHSLRIRAAATEETVRSVSATCGATLTSLDLLSCTALTARAVRGLCDGRLAQLRALRLRGCDLADDAVGLLPGGCPRLVTLDLAYNRRLRDGAVAAIVQSCGLLRELCLDGIRGLSVAALQPLLASGASNPPPHSLLEVLSLRHNANVAPASLRPLLAACPHLRRLSVGAAIFGEAVDDGAIGDGADGDGAEDNDPEDGNPYADGGGAVAAWLPLEVLRTMRGEEEHGCSPQAREEDAGWESLPWQEDGADRGLPPGSLCAAEEFDSFSAGEAVVDLASRPSSIVANDAREAPCRDADQGAS